MIKILVKAQPAYILDRHMIVSTTKNLDNTKSRVKKVIIYCGLNV